MGIAKDLILKCLSSKCRKSLSTSYLCAKTLCRGSPLLRAGLSGKFCEDFKVWFVRTNLPKDPLVAYRPMVTRFVWVSWCQCKVLSLGAAGHLCDERLGLLELLCAIHSRSKCSNWLQFPHYRAQLSPAARMVVNGKWGCNLRQGLLYIIFWQSPWHRSLHHQNSHWTCLVCVITQHDSWEVWLGTVKPADVFVLKKKYWYLE